jgi:hypothetical protein
VLEPARVPDLPTGNNHHVGLEQLDKLLDACPDPEWKALFALCRLAGLRREEARVLPFSGKALDRDGVERHVGVDFDARRLYVVAVKTGIFRTVPLGPQLHDILLEAFDAAAEGQQTVTGLTPNNLIRNAQRIARAAGLTPWPKFYQAMRSSCENEWKAEGVAEATYAAWLGHDPSVSRKHYVSPTEEEFARITKAA